MDSLGKTPCYKVSNRQYFFTGASLYVLPRPHGVESVLYLAEVCYNIMTGVGFLRSGFRSCGGRRYSASLF